MRKKKSPDSRSYSPSKMSSEAIHRKCQSGKQVQADLLLWAKYSAALKLSKFSSSYRSTKKGRKNRGMKRSFCRDPCVFWNVGSDTCSVQPAGKGLCPPQPAPGSRGGGAVHGCVEAENASLRWRLCWSCPAGNPLCCRYHENEPAVEPLCIRGRDVHTDESIVHFSQILYP